MANDKKKRREEEERLAKAHYASDDVRMKAEAPKKVVRNYGIKPLYQRIDERKQQARMLGRDMRSEQNAFMRDAMAGGIQAARENQQKRQTQRDMDMAIELIRTGKMELPDMDQMPEVVKPGYGYKRAGNQAVYATPNSPLPDPKKAKTATRAQAPGAFGISPYEYGQGMKAIREQEAFGKRERPAATKDTMANEGARNFLDKWFPEKGNELPTQDEMLKKWAQVEPYQQDLYWMDYQNVSGAIDEHRLSAEEGAAAYDEEKIRRQAAFDDAIRLMGEDAPQYANETEADQLGRFAHTYGMGDAAKKYAQEYKVPGLFENYDAHDAEMYMIMHPEQKEKLSQYAGTENETGYSILHREMTQDQKDIYMALAAVHGEEAAQDWLRSLLRDKGYNERAYWTRDEALREYANEHPVLATGKSFLYAPLQISGVGYAVGQALKGEKIDPFDFAFAPTQAVQTPRDEVSQMITRNYGTVGEDGQMKDNLLSWLMKAGYSAATSGGDSIIAAGLGMGIPGAGAAIQGVLGASGQIQDASMRGADTADALLKGGVSAVIETATEYLPMEHFIKTMDSGDIRTVKDVLVNTLKGGLTEAPGEGASELLGYISDELIMGEMSNWDALVAEKGVEGAAAQVAWDVFNGAFVGFLSGTGTSTLAGTKAAVQNTLTEKPETAMPDVQKPAPETPAVEQTEEQETAQQDYWEPEAEPDVDKSVLRQEREVTGRRPEAKQTIEQEQQDYWEPEAEPDVDKSVLRQEREVTGRRPQEEQVAEDTVETPAAPAEENEQPAQEQQAKEQQAKEKEPAKAPENAKKGNPLRQERAVTVRRGKTEQQMTVTGVEAVNNGSVFLNVRNEDGETETVAAGDVEFEDPATNELLATKQAASFDGKTASIFLEGYNAKLASPQEYAQAFASAYEDGKAGLEYERMLQVDRMASTYLTSEARLKAYAAGMNAYNKKSAETGKTGGVQRKYSADAWRLLDGERKKRARANLELADALGKRMARKITVVDRVTDNDGNEVNGRYNPKTGEIEVALNADAEAYAYVAMHELTHAIKAEHKDAWHDFENFVADALERSGQDLADLVDEQMSRYGLDGEAAMEEVICNTVPALLKDEQNLLNLYKGNRTLFERVMDWVRNFLDDIKDSGDILAKGSRDWKQMDALKQNREDMQTILQMMENIFDSEGKEKAHSSEGAEMGEVKASRKNEAKKTYNFSKSFAEQISDWKNGSFPKDDTIVVGKTPDVLQKIGMPALPLTMSQKVLKENLLSVYRGTEEEKKDHAITETEMKKIPSLVAEPVAVIADRRLVRGEQRISQSTVDVIVEMQINGKETLVPIQISGNAVMHGRGIDANVIASVHGNRDTAERLLYAIENDGKENLLVFYANKEKTIASLRKAGYAITGWPLDGNGHIHSIQEKGSPVKVRVGKQQETKQFKYWFNGSKITNADGTPKLMYRGGGEDIEIFDRKKSKASNLYGRGFYFTDSESHAKQYGEARAYYLNVKNPLDASSNAKRISEKQLRAFLEAVAEDEDYGLENYGYGATVDSVMAGLKGKNDFDVLQDINATAIGDFAAAIELFNDVNGTSYDGIITPTETVVFDSRQIKSATDNVGTFDPENPNVKFSRKGLEEGVEETRDLIAVHNMTEENLRAALELGGLAMPSIAVIKAQQGHTKYGPISAVFDKYTIDPETFRDNEVYGGDAWTPTFPQVRYEASEKAWDRISKKYYELEKKVGNQTARIMYPYVSDLDEELNRKGGVQGIVKRLEDSTDMMQMYLADNGWEKTEPEKKVVVKRTAKHLAEQYDSLIEKMGEDVIRGFEAPEGAKIGDHRRAWMAEHGEKLKQAYIEVLADATGLPEANVAPLAEDKANVRKMIMDAYYYLKNGGEIREEVTDYEGFNKMIRAQVDRPAYRKWLEELFKGAEKRKGIRNNKDIFTPSGNRRSFAQTHWELTLENAVKAMRAEEKTGVGSIGGRNIEGAAVKKYGSIKEMKADSGRLRMVPEEEYELMRQSFREHFNDLAREYAMDKDEVNGDWIDAGNALVDYITKAQTADGIYKLMQKDAKFYRPSRSLAEDLAELVEEMKNAPTGYFEAKPRRAVGFDEVAALLVPDNLPDDLRNQLKENGIDLIDYEAGNEDDRLNKMNSEQVSGLRFSRKGLDANIDEELEHARDAFELVRHSHRITAAEADQLAGKILKEAQSTYDRATLAGEIAEIMDYIERADTVNMDHVDEMETSLMARVMEQSRVLDEEHEQLVDPIRQYFKGTHIKMTETQIKEAANLAGSYAAYRRQVMGRVKLSKNTGTELDVAWEELHDINPEWFPLDVAEGDMPEMLLQVVDAMKPAYNTVTNLEETASWLAGKLNEAYFALPAVKAGAKNKTQLGTSVKEMRQAMTRFAEASGETFGEALKQLEKTRKKNKDASDQEAWNELRRQWNEWKAKDADEREERFQMDLQRAKDKLKANDLAMRTVYAKVMAEAYKRQRAKDMAETREREALKKQRARTEATARTLMNWLEKPTDAKHVPASLDEPLKNALLALDFGGKDTKVAKGLSERLEQLATAVEQAQERENDERTMFLERDQQMVDELRRVAQLIKGNTEGRGVYDLNSMELKELNKWLGAIRHTVLQASKMHGTNLGDVQQVAAESIQEIAGKKPMKDKKWITKQWESLFGPDMMDSFTFFERLGPTSTRVFNELRKGFDKTTQLIRGAEKRTKEMLKDADLKKLSGKKAEKLKVDVRGRTVEMTRANIMELYVLNKRDQARGHIYKGGFRIKGDEDAHPLLVKEEDVAKITDLLTDEEKRIADAMQEYLSKECAAWGNETSMKLLGYEKFGEESYWPIMTDSNERNTTKLEENFAANIAAIKNQGMTKQLIEGASNAIIIGDIFDTYTQHISNMSAYAGYAVPLSDMQRWINSRGVKTEIEHVMGAKGKQYINNFLMAVNGTAARQPMTGLEKVTKAAARNAKTAAVGGNIRVIVQQPTSYARAAMYMSPKYLMEALAAKKPDAELVNKYCSIAAWKRYGFYETNVGPGMREMIVGDTGAVNKLRDIMMKPAAAGDNWTLNHLWAACELETADVYPELEKGSDEYYQKVGERMSEIIDRTQVVDSPFHRSQIMRSKNSMAQTLTNFMSEPTKTFNMLTSAIYAYADNRKNPAARARVARALGVWAATSVLTAAAAGIVDAFRDDDEEKKWLEKYGEAVLGNTVDSMNPLGMLPGVKDALSIIQGYDPSRIDQQSIQRIYWAYQEIAKYLNGTSKMNLYGVTYKVAQALSSTTGIPLSNVMRDLNAVAQSVTGINLTLNDKARKNQTIDGLYDTMTEAGKAKTTKEKDAAKKKIDEARAKLTKIGMNPKEIDTALAERLAEDPRIKAAWEAKQAHKVGDVNRTKNALAHEGFTGEMVDKAIAEYGKTATPKEEKGKDMNAQLKAKLFTQDEAVAAIRAGASNEDIEYMMSELVSDSGAKDPEKSVRDGLKAEVKKDYLEAVKKGDRSKADRSRDILTSVLKVPEADLTKWEQEQHADDLRLAIDAYNSVSAAKAVDVMRADGKSDSDIKGSLGKYRQMYIDAVRNKDSRTANKIKSLLLGLGLMGKNGKPLYTEETFADWVK